jgi:hypothetical protein
VVLAQVATYSEIMEKWNLCDLHDANEALDIKDEAEAYNVHMSRMQHAKLKK